MIETVSYHINSLELLTEAKPFLNDMLQDLGLTSHLGILDGCDVVYLERMDIYPSTRLYTQGWVSVSGILLFHRENACSPVCPEMSWMMPSTCAILNSIPRIRLRMSENSNGI